MSELKWNSYSTGVGSIFHKRANISTSFYAFLFIPRMRNTVISIEELRSDSVSTMLVDNTLLYSESRQFMIHDFYDIWHSSPL
jgi:hypothetical protein